MPTNAPTVNTFNEWDPLEEIIIGRVDDDTLVPPWDTIMPAVIHDKTQWDFYKTHGGKPWPEEMLSAAHRNVEELVHILETEGVTVRRPDAFAYDKPLSTPDWNLPSSCYALMPRDVLFIIGDLIIEAPMGLRSRTFEHATSTTSSRSVEDSIAPALT